MSVAFSSKKQFNSTQLQFYTLGNIEYTQADKIQRDIQKKRQTELVSDSLLLLEHPNVITLGKRGAMSDILVGSNILKEQQVQVVQTDRGGQNTIHAPGQLVGYLIIHLYKKQRALRQFVYNLEQSLINTLKEFGIVAFRHPKHVGVWTDAGKIAAIGISVNYGVTRHGFALNVCTALDVFDWIVPCGIQNAKVTSMSNLLGKKIQMQEVEKCFIKNFVNQNNYTTTKHITYVPKNFSKG